MIATIIGIAVAVCEGLMVVDIEGMYNAEYWIPLITVLTIGKLIRGLLEQSIVEKASFLIAIGVLVGLMIIVNRAVINEIK